MESHKSPLTIVGFCKYLGIAKSTFYAYKEREEFSDIYARVRESIEADQIEGAMLDVYTPSITARLLGLKEQADITTDGEKINPPQQPTSIIAYYNDKRLELTGDDIDGRDE